MTQVYSKWLDLFLVITHEIITGILGWLGSETINRIKAAS